MIEDPWESFASELKAQLWGISSQDADDLYHAKYSGEKIEHPRTASSQAWTEYILTEGYTTERYLAHRLAGIPKTSSAVTRRGQLLRATRKLKQ